MASKNLKLGIIGYPLSHTRSPAMQAAGLDYLGIEGSYEKFEIEPEKLDEELLKLFKQIDGLNVTIPHKETVLKYIDEADPLVERIGAANTLIIEETNEEQKAQSQKIKAYNTDYYGFIESLNLFYQRYFDKSTNAKQKLEGKQITVLGAGGAAKAVLVALEDLNVGVIDIYARNPEKAQDSIPKISKAKIKILQANIDLSNTSLLINCTPVGQGKASNEMPISSEALKTMAKDSLVYDLIYPDTKLLSSAKKLGLSTISGSDMLILQGAKSLSIWTEEKVSGGLIKAMRTGFQNTH